MRKFIICTPHQIFGGDQITKDGMGCACGTYGGEKRYIQGLVGKPKGKRNLGRSKIHGRWL